MVHKSQPRQVRRAGTSDCAPKPIPQKTPRARPRRRFLSKCDDETRRFLRAALKHHHPRFRMNKLPRTDVAPYGSHSSFAVARRAFIMRVPIFTTLLAALVAVVFAAGCYHDTYHVDCDLIETNCCDYCEAYCDYWTCWEECYPVCQDTCISVPTYECDRDRDCGRNEYCDRGYCVDRGGNNGNDGKAGLCEPCYYDDDCKERGAMCLFFEGQTEDDAFCGRVCTKASDCPNGYTCIDVGDGNQCVPAEDECVDLIGKSCDRSSQCARGEECVDQRCRPKQDVCSSDRDCAQNESCVSGSCKPRQGACTQDNECPQNQHCEAGYCKNGADLCTSDRDCTGTDVCISR